MAYLHPRDWIDSLPNGFNDYSSFRNMRMIAKMELDELNRIRGEIVEKHGEQTAIDEWDFVFSDDTRRCREAIEMIDHQIAAIRVRA